MTDSARADSIVRIASLSAGASLAGIQPGCARSLLVNTPDPSRHTSLSIAAVSIGPTWVPAASTANHAGASSEDASSLVAVDIVVVGGGASAKSAAGSRVRPGEREPPSAGVAVAGAFGIVARGGTLGAGPAVAGRDVASRRPDPASSSTHDANAGKTRASHHSSSPSRHTMASGGNIAHRSWARITRKLTGPLVSPDASM